MTDTHNIPMLEDDLHILSKDCRCHPVKDIDEETGRVTWVHIPLRLDKLIDQLDVT